MPKINTVREVVVRSSQVAATDRRRLYVADNEHNDTTGRLAVFSV